MSNKYFFKKTMPSRADGINWGEVMLPPEYSDSEEEEEEEVPDLDVEGGGRNNERHYRNRTRRDYPRPQNSDSEDGSLDENEEILGQPGPEVEGPVEIDDRFLIWYNHEMEVWATRELFARQNRFGYQDMQFK